MYSGFIKNILITYFIKLLDSINHWIGARNHSFQTFL